MLDTLTTIAIWAVCIGSGAFVVGVLAAAFAEWNAHRVRRKFPVVISTIREGFADCQFEKVKRWAAENQIRYHYEWGVVRFRTVADACLFRIAFAGQK